MIPIKNIDIRSEIKSAGLKLWEIADALGMTDSYFSRKLRHELPEADKEKIRDTIKRLEEN